MYTIASSSVANRFRTKIDKDTEENVETNTKKKCFEQRFAEHDLCPFVSNKKVIHHWHLEPDIFKIKSCFSSETTMVLRDESGSTGHKSNYRKSRIIGVCLFACGHNL